jgi:hypothetical protein
MPITSRRMWPALAGALLSLLAVGAFVAPVALAGSPATVTVRVLAPTGSGSYETLTPITQVTTNAAEVTKDGGACSGTSAMGALNLATHGDWEGTWESGFDDYELITIDGKSYPFEAGSPANYYWSFWRNNVYSEEGECGVELEAGDQILFFPSCYGPSCPAPPEVLAIEAPPTAEVGQPVTIAVNRYNAEGKHAPAAGVNVGGWGASTTTNFEGKATLTFPGDETYTLRVSGIAGEEPMKEPAPVPGEALVCAHAGDDGTCGTSAPADNLLPASSTTTTSTTVTAPYTGPYAVVADVSGIREGHVYARGQGPRVLSGTVTAHAPVTSISLRLRRTYRGRCWAYSGSRERLQRLRCRQGGFFQIASGGDSFSYLLPSRLPPGRYVLDIAATDSAGGMAPLDRGSSRIVFYVK